MILVLITITIQLKQTLPQVPVPSRPASRPLPPRHSHQPRRQQPGLPRRVRVDQAKAAHGARPQRQPAHVSGATGLERRGAGAQRPRGHVRRAAAQVAGALEFGGKSAEWPCLHEPQPNVRLEVSESVGQ